MVMMIVPIVTVLLTPETVGRDLLIEEDAKPGEAVRPRALSQR